jgi:hypothetical protein
MLPGGHTVQFLLLAVEHCVLTYEPAEQFLQLVHSMSLL